ncbi:ribonuclease III [Candidatus Roizmanbacteria bacterium CG_4_10_14_0_8_um_filter_39_9]|uniref:Ribonuclease 3 n=1 Tax=Candidatus Roizmanbacteria bacterium CG_4_10_14_0_8_um_filter_39_9 TaxID=1974829 RepID=A0A2M7QCI8_9BACT|nr:MAG: ribonuclease III [Candidatus Roizmanbacteria bacterium CG_4_10_14_0_8_um_filter_39_9]
MSHNLSLLEKSIGIDFKDKKLLENIFIHRSYLNEHKTFYLPSNEKLEFLGDSVLSLVTSIYLYKHFPELNEGIYTDVKASVVRTESLAEVAKRLHLGQMVYLSKGEEQNSGKNNKNILADCFESLIGGIFIDHGFDSAYAFIEKWLFHEKLSYIVRNKLYLSPKSRLQEYLQAKYRVLPIYTLLKEIGPEHKKSFTVAVFHDKDCLGEGLGNSKKEAEEAAAKNALEKITD